jgi:hypothetical protein
MIATAIEEVGIYEKKVFCSGRRTTDNKEQKQKTSVASLSLSL